MKFKNLVNAIGDIGDNHQISKETIIAALSEGLGKAYAKHIKCPDAVVRVEVGKDDEIHIYQVKTIVEEVEDDEIEVALEDALELNPDAKLGDTIENEVSITEFGRNSVGIVKNVMTQKIKEATKQVIYDEYIDKLDDLVYGTVETVEDKFVLVNLGKTLGLMQKSEQIPNERYYDGQRIRVIIKDVNKDSKGSQVIVSRASANLVKRLFEATVSDIYDGTVEIKAIAREANERTKMAVYSKNPNVDAIGACIGPRGQRVVAVIDEITDKNNPASHENIDIVEWNPDFVEYVKNVLKPANVIAVVPNDENDNLLIVVDDNQLSLAIGRKGINARLAVKLLNKKIDIKTKSDVEAMGIDYMGKMMEFQAKEAAKRRAAEAAKLAEAQEAARLAEEAKKAAAQLDAIVEDVEEVETVVEEVEDVVATPVVEEVIEEVQPVVEEETAPVVEEKVEEEVKETTKRKKAKLTVKASDYVSKYETLADAKKEEKTTSTKRKKAATKEELEAQEVKEQLEALKNKEYEIKPEYSDEELEEFNNAEDEHWYDDEDVDYDEYDEFYDK